jgi:hypothetical protein
MGLDGIEAIVIGFFWPGSIWMWNGFWFGLDVGSAAMNNSGKMNKWG